MRWRERRRREKNSGLWKKREAWTGQGLSGDRGGRGGKEDQEGSFSFPRKPGFLDWFVSTQQTFLEQCPPNRRGRGEAEVRSRVAVFLALTV